MDNVRRNSGRKAREEAPKFGAFISYSHADAAKVRKLHSQIEAYHLPKGLGAIDALNHRQGKLNRVFRDREDLSAAQDLSSAVTDALDRSNVLLVACSPDARASRWVNQEIDYFKEHYPERPILAAILSGEPAEAFPNALTEGGAEPLAADLRKEGDGWRLGFLKLVAGIAGVPLDMLIERDGRRRTRRVMAVTGVVALIAVAMAAMTTVALQARNEAQFQQTEAEGLVAYMMDELRDELKGVGRLDVMAGVNKRALEYYTNQGDLSGLPPASLEQRAKILHAMGEDETDTVDGDLESALGKFTEAHRTTKELLAREPDNPDRIYVHAQSEYWVGWIAELREDFRGAHAQYERYRDLARELARFEPDSHRTLMELGWGELNVGIMSFKQDDLVAAGEEFDLAISSFEQANTMAPRDRSTQDALVNAHAWRFNTHYNLGEFEQALDQRAQSVAIIQQVLADKPEDREAQFSLLVAQRAVALTRIELGQIEQGQAELRDVAARARSLAQRDSSNREWADFAKKFQAK